MRLVAVAVRPRLIDVRLVGARVDLGQQFAGVDQLAVKAICMICPWTRLWATTVLQLGRSLCRRDKSARLRSRGGATTGTAGTAAACCGVTFLADAWVKKGGSGNAEGGGDHRSSTQRGPGDRP